MNLIPCSQPCAYQNEGLCTLSSPLPVIGCQVDGCCYFSPKAFSDEKQ